MWTKNLLRLKHRRTSSSEGQRKFWKSFPFPPSARTPRGLFSRHLRRITVYGRGNLSQWHLRGRREPLLIREKVSTEKTLGPGPWEDKKEDERPLRREIRRRHPRRKKDRPGEVKGRTVLNHQASQDGRRQKRRDVSSSRRFSGCHVHSWLLLYSVCPHIRNIPYVPSV